MNIEDYYKDIVEEEDKGNWWEAYNPSGDWESLYQQYPDTDWDKLYSSLPKELIGELNNER